MDSGPLHPEVKVCEWTYRTTVTIMKNSSSSVTLEADSILHAEVIDALVASRPGCAIVAECRPENDRSRALLRRVGFVPTGLAGRRPAVG